MTRIAILVSVLVWTSAWAENEQERKAREEIEQQLKSMVEVTPPKLKLDYIGLDHPQYKLTEAAFSLDGSDLPLRSIVGFDAEGAHAVFHGEIKPGKHKLELRLVFTDTADLMMSAESGVKWKVGSTVSFTTQPGLEVHLQVTPSLDSMAKDKKQKFSVKTASNVVMVAKLDDGKMPEPLARRPELEAALAQAEKKRLADEKKQKADETKASKRASADEKKRATDEALALKREEKKRRAEEAREAKRAAAEEKKRAADESLEQKREEKKRAAEEKKRAAEELQSEKLDPKKRRAAEDAVLAAADTPPPPEPSEPPKPEPSPTPAAAPSASPAQLEPSPTASPVPATPERPLPWPIFAGVAVALLGIITFLVARRAARGPQLPPD